MPANLPTATCRRYATFVRRRPGKLVGYPSSSRALGPGASGDFLARLPTTVVSSTRPAGSLSALTLSPNPARAALAVGGVPAVAAVAVFNALGRRHGPPALAR